MSKAPYFIQHTPIAPHITFNWVFLIQQCLDRKLNSCLNVLSRFDPCHMHFLSTDLHVRKWCGCMHAYFWRSPFGRDLSSFCNIIVSIGDITCHSKISNLHSTHHKIIPPTLSILYIYSLCTHYHQILVYFWLQGLYEQTVCWPDSSFLMLFGCRTAARYLAIHRYIIPLS